MTTPTPPTWLPFRALAATGTATVFALNRTRRFAEYSNKKASNLWQAISLLGIAFLILVGLSWLGNTFDVRLIAAILWLVFAVGVLILTNHPYVWAVGILLGQLYRGSAKEGAETTFWVQVRIQLLFMLHFLPLVFLSFKYTPNTYVGIIFASWFLWTCDSIISGSYRRSFKLAAWVVIVVCATITWWPQTVIDYFSEKTGRAEVMAEPILGRQLEDVRVIYWLSPADCPADAPCYSTKLGKKPGVSAADGVNDWRLEPISRELAEVHSFPELTLGNFVSWPSRVITWISIQSGANPPELLRSGALIELRKPLQEVRFRVGEPEMQIVVSRPGIHDQCISWDRRHFVEESREPGGIEVTLKVRSSVSVGDVLKVWLRESAECSG